jgi:acylphosphatase
MSALRDLVAVTGTVSGRVQGVGFRISAQWEARRIGVTGWVRNLPDGRVEVHAQGTESQVGEFTTWLSRGPRAARVTAIQVYPVDPDPGSTTFDVR